VINFLSPKTEKYSNAKISGKRNKDFSDPTNPSLPGKKEIIDYKNT